MREDTPNPIYLKDYAPPLFLVETVDLFIELDEENTRVTARLRIRHNPGTETRSNRLKLDGENLELESLKLNGLVIPAECYQLEKHRLIIADVPSRPFEIEIVTRIHPRANTALEGLYLSGGMFCTQCEAQGFRKITYFPDRPDVMAIYSTTLVADRTEYPVLLSNGNLVASGELLNNRHWAKWEDPFPKPCYLFALVAGRLACLEDRHVTPTGREVALKIFVESHDLDKCGHAMESLKNAMRWDEINYGREYDLDLYMIVAVSHFNMGAMENKGLNIFNTRYVLARPDTATDSDYEHIEGVIGHEYFHNWTGNRITCRDWFQLSLKEGLTVFRDQEFSADRHSRAVKRIDEVNVLRTRQFAEDGGPLAHPVRPESYIEINNFYTLTVYEKGAEVVRMIHTLLGPEGFRRGTDLYFDRHDGQAVTCEDFVKCMEDATQADLTRFRRWYEQAGTPEITVTTEYFAEQGELEVCIRQMTAPTPGQPDKQPLHIPFAMGLLGPDGEELPLRLAGETEADPRTTRILDILEPEHRFRFTGLPASPTLSALRGFSAPVRLHQPLSDAALSFLLAHDTDTFNRWDAGQRLAAAVILGLAGADTAVKASTEHLLEAWRHLLRQPWNDLSYLSLLLTLPSDEYVSAGLQALDPIAIHEAIRCLRRRIAHELREELLGLYHTHHRDEFNQFDAAAIGRRRLKNICLACLSELDTPESHGLALAQFKRSRTMTDRIAALAAIVDSSNPARDECLGHFYQQWHADELVVGKWFTLQAACRLPGGLERVRALLRHPGFDLRMPNHVRAVIGSFTQSNPVNFHAADGSGYAFLADQIIELNAINPQIAARMLTPLAAWKRYGESRQQQIHAALNRIMATDQISPDVFEVASKTLA